MTSLVAEQHAQLTAREDGYIPPRPISHVRPHPTLNEDALYGPIGQIVTTIRPETEAHPAGLLFGFLTAAGNMIGVEPRPHIYMGADMHTTVLNAITVGESSKARKGHGRSYSRLIASQADPLWASRIVSGHASGESLIDDLLPDEEGNIDPRLYVQEGEFSRVLKVADRKGSILGDMVRNAWDGIPLANRRTSETRGRKKVAEKHHVSIVGDITVGELRTELSETNAINGFGNRFLWVLVRRVRRLPMGGDLTHDDFAALAHILKNAVTNGRKVGQMYFSPAAKDVWADWYMKLPEGSSLFHTVTARNEANTLRMAMIYAALDGSPEIDVHHLVAAFAAWDYARDSAHWLFGKTTGDLYADRIIAAAKEAGDQGVSHSQIRERVLKSNNVTAERIAQALQVGEEAGDLWFERVATGGRPLEVVMHTDFPVCRRLGSA